MKKRSLNAIVTLAILFAAITVFAQPGGTGGGSSGGGAPPGGVGASIDGFDFALLLSVAAYAFQVLKQRQLSLNSPDCF